MCAVVYAADLGGYLYGFAFRVLSFVMGLCVLCRFMFLCLLFNRLCYALEFPCVSFV